MYIYITSLHRRSPLFFSLTCSSSATMKISLDGMTNTFPSTIQILVIVLFILIMLIKRSTKIRAYKKLPPGPLPWPIVGCIPEMLTNKPVFRWIHRTMKELDTEIACFRLGNTHVIPVTSPEIAREILKNKDSIFASRPTSFATKTFSGGYRTAVISPYGDQWKKMRKVLTSEIICPARHKWLREKRTEEADNLVSYIYNQYKWGKKVNLRIAVRFYSGNVIRRLTFDKRYFYDSVPDDAGPSRHEIDHVEALFTALGYIYAFCISDYFPWLIGLDLDGHEKIVKEANRVIEKYNNPVIEERIQYWRSRDKKPSGKKMKKTVEDLLDVLITLNDSKGEPLLTTEEIKAQSRVSSFQYHPI